MLDEAEKAHIDVYQNMLQVFDGGRLTSGQGEKIDFRETYIILTSNVGTRHFLNDAISFEQAEQLALQAIKEMFPPEFIGRLDGIVCFKRLGMPMLIRVAQRRLDALNRGIASRQLRIEMPEADKERFCTRYQDANYGARPILKAMKATLEADLSIAILENTSGAGTFHCTFNDQLDVKFQPNE